MLTFAPLAAEQGIWYPFTMRNDDDDREKRPGPRPGDPRCVAGGRKGGLRTVAVYGCEHFAAIGKRGGKTTVDRYGREHMRDLPKTRRTAEDTNA